MLSSDQASVIKGMLARGDRQQDIAAHFRLNSGRVAEISTGAKFADVPAAPSVLLPSLDNEESINPKWSLPQQYARLLDWIKNPPKTSRVITFTPELAQHILEKLNHNNRRSRPANIRRFSNSMSQSMWLLTGDTVKFSVAGYLLDGQNRLRACVRAGVPFTTHVVFGVPDDAFDRIDNNAVRTNPDTFEIAGIPHSSVAAPAVRWIILDRERINGAPPDRGRKLDNNELRTYYNSHIDADQLTEACRIAKNIGRVLPTGQLAGYLYLFGEKHRGTMELFGRELIDRKRAGRTLIEKITRLRKQNMGRINELQGNALIIQAWNAIRNKEKLRSEMLNWDENKAYPSII